MTDYSAFDTEMADLCGRPEGPGNAKIYRRHAKQLAEAIEAEADHRDAIADTRPQGGDAKQAPFTSGGDAEGNRTTSVTQPLSKRDIQ